MVALVRLPSWKVNSRGEREAAARTAFGDRDAAGMKRDEVAVDVLVVGQVTRADRALDADDGDVGSAGDARDERVRWSRAGSRSGHCRGALRPRRSAGRRRGTGRWRRTARPGCPCSMVPRRPGLRGSRGRRRCRTGLRRRRCRSRDASSRGIRRGPWRAARRACRGRARVWWSCSSMPAGMRRSIDVSGGGAAPSLVERWKAKLIVVGAPSRSGAKDASSVACSATASALAGREAAQQRERRRGEGGERGRRRAQRALAVE